ncbi:MAG TPA: hypothetical protein VFP84_17710 [Kofleriaceae bacterium]|nr:hypothetical protein [Kofleriaceae bacterium]
MRSPTLFSLTVAAALLAGCKSSATSSSPACDQMRPAFAVNEKERATADARTRLLPEAERQKMIDTAVDVAMAVCVQDHWTEAQVKCLLANPRAKGSECGFPPPGFRHLNQAIAASYAKLYGPPKDDFDDYTKWAGSHNAEHRNADGSPELPKDHGAHPLVPGAGSGSGVDPAAGSAAPAPAGGGW